MKIFLKNIESTGLLNLLQRTKESIDSKLTALGLKKKNYSIVPVGIDIDRLISDLGFTVRENTFKMPDPYDALLVTRIKTADGAERFVKLILIRKGLQRPVRNIALAHECAHLLLEHVPVWTDVQNREVWALCYRSIAEDDEPAELGAVHLLVDPDDAFQRLKANDFDFARTAVDFNIPLDCFIKWYALNDPMVCHYLKVYYEKNLRGAKGRYVFRVEDMMLRRHGSIHYETLAKIIEREDGAHLLLENSTVLSRSLQAQRNRSGFTMINGYVFFCNVVIDRTKRKLYSYGWPAEVFAQIGGKSITSSELGKLKNIRILT